MKIVAQPIECIAWFDQQGRPTPMKFRIMNDEGNRTVRVDQVIHREIEKLAGNKMYIFECQSNFKQELKRYQLKYELDTCKWILFKI